MAQCTTHGPKLETWLPTAKILAKNIEKVIRTHQTIYSEPAALEACRASVQRKIYTMLLGLPLSLQEAFEARFPIPVPGAIPVASRYQYGLYYADTRYGVDWYALFFKIFLMNLVI